MEFTILKYIVIILALSTFVNLIFTRLKVPTVVGYMLTGIIAGPHLLGLIGSGHELELMAEIGVVLLMFSIGLEYSMKHLFRIRRIVFFGGFIQVIVTAAVFFGLTRFYGMEWKPGIFMAFIVTLSSSALVLKLLQDRSELSSNYGRTVLGILIFQDLIFVPLILFTNLLGNVDVEVGKEIVSLLLKTTFIVGFAYVGNKWLFPKLLYYIAQTKNQELFMMSIFLICLAIALLTSKLGMSLAFGAFFAGLMVSDSEYSHNAFGTLIPFKDTFTSFFFVSIGMLLDLNFVVDNYFLVIVTVLLVIFVKTIIAGGTGFILGHTFKGTILIGLALSQVGEFSFILAKIGVKTNIISGYFYQLFLAVAIITMSASPFLIKFASKISDLFLRLPMPDLLRNGLFPLKEMPVPELKNHLVIIGKDNSALKIPLLAQYVHLPYVSVVFDPASVKEMLEKGQSVIYGDAVHESILRKAHVDTADIVLVSIGSIIVSLEVIDCIRRVNKHVFILVRATSIEHLDQIYKAGADQVFPEKFEIAINLFDRVLTKRLMPRNEINILLARIRDDYYGIFREEEMQTKNTVFDELPSLEIEALTIHEKSKAVGKTLSEIRLRNTIGVTLLAVKRDAKVIEHPAPNIIFRSEDIVYILGNPENISVAYEYFGDLEHG